MKINNRYCTGKGGLVMKEYREDVFVSVRFVVQDIIDVLIKTGDYSEEKVNEIIEMKDAFRSIVFQQGLEILMDM